MRGEMPGRPPRRPAPWLLLLLLQLALQRTCVAYDPYTCVRSNYACSRGKVKSWIGPLESVKDMKAALSSLAYKKEIIISEETRLDYAAAWVHRVQQAGFDHVVRKEGCGMHAGGRSRRFQGDTEIVTCLPLFFAIGPRGGADRTWDVLKHYERSFLPSAHRRSPRWPAGSAVGDVLLIGWGATRAAQASASAGAPQLRGLEVSADIRSL